ncbi:MAG: hypothetical protein JXQ96_23485, partial [Cyclobacteriaceae bacterium]
MVTNFGSALMFISNSPLIGRMKPTVFFKKVITGIITLIYITSFANAQKIDRYIKEKNVTRIVSTLASDDMMGLDLQQKT